MLPDGAAGGEIRAIWWDDVAGTVGGLHSDVPELRRILEAPKPVTVGGPGGTWDLRDPGRNPAEFLVAVSVAVTWEVLAGELRDALPPVFDDVEIPASQPGEALYDGHGNLIT